MCKSCNLIEILEAAKAFIETIEIFDRDGNRISLKEFTDLEAQGREYALVEATTDVRVNRRERRHVVTVWQGFDSLVLMGPMGRVDLGAPRIFETAIVTDYVGTELLDIDIQARTPNVIAARAAHDQIVELAKSRQYQAPRH